MLAVALTQRAPVGQGMVPRLASVNGPTLRLSSMPARSCNLRSLLPACPCRSGASRLLGTRDNCASCGNKCHSTQQCVKGAGKKYSCRCVPGVCSWCTSLPLMHAAVRQASVPPTFTLGAGPAFLHAALWRPLPAFALRAPRLAASPGRVQGAPTATSPQRTAAKPA